MHGEAHGLAAARALQRHRHRISSSSAACSAVIPQGSVTSPAAPPCAGRPDRGRTSRGGGSSTAVTAPARNWAGASAPRRFRPWPRRRGRERQRRGDMPAGDVGAGGFVGGPPAPGDARLETAGEEMRRGHAGEGETLWDPAGSCATPSRTAPAPCRFRRNWRRRRPARLRTNTELGCSLSARSASSRPSSKRRPRST